MNASIWENIYLCKYQVTSEMNTLFIVGMALQAAALRFSLLHCGGWMSLSILVDTGSYVKIANTSVLANPVLRCGGGSSLSLARVARLRYKVNSAMGMRFLEQKASTPKRIFVALCALSLKKKKSGVKYIFDSSLLLRPRSPRVFLNYLAETQCT